MSQNQDYVEASKVNEISNGQMKHVEINGKEIVIANLNGKFYAFAERCGHMNARLSRGNITQNTVTCPFHAAKFDITSGKKNRGAHIRNPTWNGTIASNMAKIYGICRKRNVIH